VAGSIHTRCSTRCGDRVLVIDEGERLQPSLLALASSSWAAPESALQAEERLVFRRALETLVERSGARCVLITQARLDDWPGEVIEHRSHDGLQLWVNQTHMPIPPALNTPGTLALVRAWHALHGPEALNALLREPPTAEPLTPQRLGAGLKQALDTAAVNILTLVDLLGGVEKDLLLHMPLDGQDDVEPTQMLIDLGLLEARGDRVEAPSFLRTADVLVPARTLPHSWLKRLAAGLLNRVSRPRHPDLEDASRIFQAHRLYVALGDFQQAVQTTQHHVGGLVELAVDVSRSGNHQGAFDCYDHILGMWRTTLPHGWWWYDQQLTPHLHSYILHYRAYNGARAEVLSAAEIQTDYRDALRGWPDNALWHGRLIALHLAHDQVDEAWKALEHAESAVRSHERRDLTLRLLPARSALRAGLVMDALQLMAPSFHDAPDDYRTTQTLHDLLSELERGVEVDLLKANPVRLSFHARQRVEVKRLSRGWLASLRGASTSRQAPLATDALEKLTRELGEEARGLMQTPSHQLSDAEVARKGRLIGLLDLLNSDIGLRFAESRWLVGRVDADQQLFTELHRTQDDEAWSCPIPPKLLPATPPNAQQVLWFARVETWRDGTPRGDVLELEPIGSGRTAAELTAELRRLSTRDGGVADESP